MIKKKYKFLNIVFTFFVFYFQVRKQFILKRRRASTVGFWFLTIDDQVFCDLAEENPWVTMDKIVEKLEVPRSAILHPKSNQEIFFDLLNKNITFRLTKYLKPIKMKPST